MANPFIQPYIAAQLDAWFLPDFNNPDLLLAQNNKQIRKRIEGLQQQIDEHKRKLEQEPDCPAANHWRKEIRGGEHEIEKLRKRLPNGR